MLFAVDILVFLRRPPPPRSTEPLVLLTAVTELLLLPFVSAAATVMTVARCSSGTEEEPGLSFAPSSPARILEPRRCTCCLRLVLPRDLAVTAVLGPLSLLLLVADVTALVERGWLLLALLALRPRDVAFPRVEFKSRLSSPPMLPISSIVLAVHRVVTSQFGDSR